MIKVNGGLWRGARPNSYADLERLGFVRVIDLQSGFQNFATDSKLEHENPSDFGIELVTIPCSDIFPPGPGETTRFLLSARGRFKSYVHCHSGVDRTGFMCAIYRMRFQNWSYDAAVREWQELGRHWWFAWWAKELKKYPRELPWGPTSTL